jgi:hypothetical protein
MAKIKEKVKRKKRIKKDIVVDREISKLTKGLEVVNKTYNVNGNPFKIYKNIPTELAVDHMTEKGRKILSSIYPDSHEIYLVQYHRPGEPTYPHGGVKIYNKTLGEQRCVYPDAVVKHKDVEYYNKSMEID